MLLNMHIYSVERFTTVNTLLKSREIENSLIEYLIPFYEAGLDAVIVQDMGVFNLIRKHFLIWIYMQAHR